MTDIFKKAAIAAASAALTLILAEAALRLTSYGGMVSQRFFRVGEFSAIGEDYDLEPDRPELLTEFPEMPYKIWSNGLGCFDRPYLGEKDPILLVGDSFTWGFSPFESKFGTLIEKALGRRVLKCGVAGYGTRQELGKARRVVKRTARPKLIIVGYFSNDLENDYAYPSMAVRNGDLVMRRKIRDFDTGELAAVADSRPRDVRSVRTWLDEHSIIYKLLKRNAAARKLASLAFPGARISPVPADISMRDPKEFPWLEKAWKKHEDGLLEFKSYADSIGARLLFVIIPQMQQVYGPFPPGVNDGRGYYNLRLSALFESRGIEYLDLLPAFRAHAERNPGARLYWKEDHHINPAGNRLAAEEILLKLRGMPDLSGMPPGPR